MALCIVVFNSHSLGAQISKTFPLIVCRTSVTRTLILRYSRTLKPEVIFSRVTHRSAEALKISTYDGCMFGFRRVQLEMADHSLGENNKRLLLDDQDAFNRPIASAPAPWIDVIERISYDGGKTCIPTGKTRRCLNLGSYNYLGFAAKDEYCTPQVLQSLGKFGVSTCGTRVDCGTNVLHLELEDLIARFVGIPAAMVYGMGFATNSATIPVLVGTGGLIVSDKLNHSSIVAGARSSGASVTTFSHNSPSNLEKILREAIVKGQPLTHRPWKKILVIVEGVYSMEGEICRLREIVKITKKYKAYLYLDEAHSIGAIGKTGRGVCELQGVNIDNVHVVMGTFTKSFRSSGGYIAGSKELLNYIRSMSPAHLYATSMPPPVVQQAISALKVIMGDDGTNKGLRKISTVRKNSNFFREELRKMGCDVLGDEDSPVIPIMLYLPSKMAAFSRECFKRNVAIVSVGFPATHILHARARMCISRRTQKTTLIKPFRSFQKSDICQLKYNPPLRLTEKEKARLAEKEKFLPFTSTKIGPLVSRFVRGSFSHHTRTTCPNLLASLIVIS